MSTSSDILIVEDDRIVADVLRRMLERAAYTVRIVHDGMAALTELTRQLPSVLVLDLNLPRMSGFIIIDQMQQRQITVPIIIITANPLYQDSLQHTAITQVLMKPFPIEELLGALRAIIGIPSPF